MQNVISIDWLSVSCKGFTDNQKDFRFVDEIWSTKIFKKVQQVFYKDVFFGIVCSIPHSNILPSDFITIKFDNKILYNQHTFHFIPEFFKLLGWTIKSILRLDICIDFQKFNNNWSPDIFLKKFAAGKILKTNKTKFTLIGSGNKAGNFQYLRIGSRASNVCTYLYNKTLEMKEIKEKSHIREVWNIAGINNENDVYRLEFSIQSNKLTYADIHSGELAALTIESIMLDSYVKSLTFELIHKYFNFKHSGNDSNISRLKDVDLFNYEQTGIIFYEKSDKLDSTKMTKYILKKVDKIFVEYKTLIPISEHTKINFLEEYINRHNLIEFYNLHKSEFINQELFTNKYN